MARCCRTVYRLSFPIHGETNKRSGEITCRWLRLHESGQHSLTHRVKHLPLRFVLQRRYGDQFAAVKTDQGGIHQFLHLHNAGNGVDIFTAMLPDFGTGGRRQDRIRPSRLAQRRAPAKETAQTLLSRRIRSGPFPGPAQPPMQY